MREVTGPVISTGMARGLHTWIAASLMVVSVLLGLVAQAITGTVSVLALLAGAFGLLGEIPHLLRRGEVRARLYGGQPNRFLVIRKTDSPLRFHFYVLIYAVLGGFSLVAALFMLSGVLGRHGG